MEQRFTIPGNKVRAGDVALIGHQKFQCHRVLRHGSVVNLVSATGDVARIAPHLLITVLRDVDVRPAMPRVVKRSAPPPLTPVSLQRVPESVPRAKESILITLLRAYRQASDGLTDVQALRAAGYDLTKDGHRRRCSDLRNNGWIEKVMDGDVPVTRFEPETGGKRMVCRITQSGHKRVTETVKRTA